jgi:hypothetical protein
MLGTKTGIRIGIDRVRINLGIVLSSLGEVDTTAESNLYRW